MGQDGMALQKIQVIVHNDITNKWTGNPLTQVTQKIDSKTAREPNEHHQHIKAVGCSVKQDRIGSSHQITAFLDITSIWMMIRIGEWVNVSSGARLPAHLGSPGQQQPFTALCPGLPG